MPQKEDRKPEAKASRPSRRSFIRYAVVGTGLVVGGAGVAVTANRPPLSPRQQNLPKLPDWTAADIPPQHGRTAIVTGGNGYPEGDRSGLGYHDALQLARAGADVTIASRKKDRGDEAVRRIRAEVPNAAIRFETLDLTDPASIKAFAERMRASHKGLDLLVNNAGVMGRINRETTPAGLERVFATNTLGHFALTAQLLPLLRAGNAPRVVWVSSDRSFGGEINFADLQEERGYDRSAAYSATKLANLMLAFEMQRRSKAEEWGVSVLAAHPGVARTNLIPDGPGPESWEGRMFTYMPVMFQPPAQGALPTLYAATSPQAQPGGYFGPNGMNEMRGLPGWAKIPAKADDQKVAATLWATLEQLGGVTFGQGA